MRLQPLPLLLLLLTATLIGCPRGRPVAVDGTRAGRVAGVLPYELSDQPGEQPDAAFLCYQDQECQLVMVRDCCSPCYPQWLAVNGPAARAIGRYNEAHPCVPDPACEGLSCPDVFIPEPARAACVSQRCVAEYE